MTHEAMGSASVAGAAGNVNARALHMLGLRPGPREGCTLAQSVAFVHERLTYAKIEHMRKQLNLERTYVVKVLEVSPSTYARNLADKGMTAAKPPVAERALRLARVVALAEQVLEDEIAARNWLAEAQPGLGGRVPQDLLASEFGAQEVEVLLHRIEEGVYV